MSKIFSLTRTRKGRTRAVMVLAAAGAMVMSSGLVLMTASTAQADPPGPHKSYVCKFVGTPGPDERLQTGQNPIWVDNHSLIGGPGEVFVGQEFTDQHGFSRVVIANTDRLDPEPGVEICGGVVVADECPELEGEQPEGFPCIMPDEVLVESDDDLSCLEFSETTTTTTTTFTFVPAEGGPGEWVAGEPEVETETVRRAPTKAEIASLGAECIAGTGSVRPTPDKETPADEPTVLGTSAAVPSAVDAGLPGAPTSGSSGASLLAQLLVAGGLVLLLTSGWLGFGRREHGAHQA